MQRVSFFFSYHGVQRTLEFLQYIYPVHIINKLTNKRKKREHQPITHTEENPMFNQ